PADEPKWLSYFDEAYLSAKFAHCFRDLEEGERVVRQARRSLDMDSRYVRGRMFNLSLLAAGLLQCGELEEACSAAASALTLASELRSAGPGSSAADLRRRREPNKNERPGMALRGRPGELTAV